MKEQLIEILDAAIEASENYKKATETILKKLDGLDKKEVQIIVAHDIDIRRKFEEFEKIEKEI
ncbi:hypothetical protein EIB75_10795 [Epilithonimonas vandammei]|uniref:Uncharacterized protein n=1 Tax=Epilithonimonas vandammei TaxID=2487072 RepID=A0A3G8ZF51_9FLAO|nr:hypothetical protein [Epilithonimonas vandammei]AZI53871.1 hypothetical protein EIB75_00755 [Epilithonimonas vandammei]AZI55710.1 hypothetical protein EIB75_10795 [Epilithonimonas vandammei]